MDKAAYAAIWKALRAFDDVTLERAIEFYESSPDGQYDNLAALALQATLEQRRRRDRTSCLS